VAFFYASGGIGPREIPWLFCLSRQEDNDMITIDIVDDDNERSAKPVVQTYPAVENRWGSSFDANYASACSFYTNLLLLAQQERLARQAKKPRSTDATVKSDALLVLNRIARVLTAWL
jgi:hypothetical protein